MYTQQAYDALQSQLKKQEIEIKAKYIAQLPQDVRDLLHDIEHGGNQKYRVKLIGYCPECADEIRILSGEHLEKEKEAEGRYNEIIRINKRLNEDLNKYQELNENKKALPGFDKISYENKLLKLSE